MHGVPPNDFPRQELAEFFTLSGRMKREAGAEKTLTERYSALSDKIRKWPRTAKNDPFYNASQGLAAHLNKETGNEVLVGYNEFCAPDVNEALAEAVNQKAEEIVVVTPMMTRGGEHAEVEIPTLVKRFQAIHPEIKTVYAWPFDTTEVAKFLTRHIARFI